MTRQEQRSVGFTENIIVAETDLALIDRYRNEPGPLLPILHAFHNRDGFIGSAAIEAIGKELRIPLADLYGTVTFYHHFAREEGGLQRPRVCTGPVCRQRGALEIVQSLDGAEEMPCSGRCDDPVPLLIGHETFVVSPPLHTLQRRISSPMPVPNPGGREECVFAEIRQPERDSLDGYRRSGGYDALTQAVEKQNPTGVIDVLKESKLAGRGGAGFPTGMKWQFVREAPRAPKSIVCNADESEPGTFKDRVLMEHRPHLLLEGIALAAYAVGTDKAIIFIRGEYPKATAILADAIREAQAAGLLGGASMGDDDALDIELRRGAGAYICGEETALFEAIEGKRGFPRMKPPYPTTFGLFGKPTAVNNVETLCAVPSIISKGADWFRAIGSDGSAGPKLVSVSGHVARPGVYEIEPGISLRHFLDEVCGGIIGELQAVLMGGAAGTFLKPEDIDVRLTFEDLREAGSTFGSGAIMVFNQTTDLRDMLKRLGRFFQHESCGKCFPCQLGTQRQVEILERLDAPRAGDAERLLDIGLTMTEASICGLGHTAGIAVMSAIEQFPDLFVTNAMENK